MMISLLFIIIMFSIDNFLVSTSYSIKNIDINNKNILIICISNTLSIFISLIFGNVLELFLSETIVKFIGFIILFSLGIYNMFQDEIKKYFSVKKRNKIINVYIDETKADFDNSKNLGLNESLVLSLILSLDSLAGGISIGFLDLNIICILTVAFIINYALLILGKYIGKYLNKYITFNLSYLCGFIIILIALFNFI